MSKRKGIIVLSCIFLCISLISCNNKPQQEQSSQSIESSSEVLSEPVSSSVSSEIVSDSSSEADADSSSQEASSESAESVRLEKKKAIMKTMDAFKFKAEASRHRYNLSYDDILRNTNKYLDTSVTFQGKVVDIIRNGDTTTGLIARHDDIDREDYIAEFSFDGDPGILKGDYIYIYGYPLEMTTYTHTDSNGATSQNYTVHLDVYYYDLMTRDIEDYQLTSEEKNYFYDTYYFKREDGRKVKVSESAIDGHPYYVDKCVKRSDGSIMIDFRFTEDLESYNQTNSTRHDSLIFNLSGEIYLLMGDRLKNETTYECGIDRINGFGTKMN